MPTTCHNVTSNFSLNASDPWDSINDPSLTYSYDKVSCWAPVYYVHIVINFSNVLMGLACLVTRYFKAYHNVHKIFGRCYITLMVLSMATALLINNTGLPIGVLISFVGVIGGLLGGYWAISIARDHEFPEWLKILHGALMITSWLNILFRAVSLPLDHTRKGECFTYPVYKPYTFHSTSLDGVMEIDNNTCFNVVRVAAHSEDAAHTPWAYTGLFWWLMITVPGFFLLGVAFILYCCNPTGRRRAHKE